MQIISIYYSTLILFPFGHNENWILRKEINNKTEILISLVPRLIHKVVIHNSFKYILETGTKADGIIGDTDVLVQPILCEEYYVPHEVPHRYYQFGTPTNLQQVAQVGTYIF